MGVRDVQKLMEMFGKKQKSKGNVQQLLLLPVQVKVMASVPNDNLDRSHKSIDCQFLFPEAKEMTLFSE